MTTLDVMPTSAARSWSTDDVRDHARRLLRRMGLHIEQVVLVDVDSVLYLDCSGRPRTAWVCADAGEVVVHDEPGFSAQQPAVGWE